MVSLGSPSIITVLARRFLTWTPTSADSRLANSPGGGVSGGSKSGSWPVKNGSAGARYEDGGPPLGGGGGGEGRGGAASIATGTGGGGASTRCPYATGHGRNHVSPATVNKPRAVR